MIVWATEFPAPSTTDPDSVLAVAEEWLRGSPHQPWRDISLASVPDNEIARDEHAGQVLLRARVRQGEDSWTGLRHTWTEDGKREWTTEVLTHRDVTGVVVAVRLECNLLTVGLPLPRPKKPYVVKLLLQRFSGGPDAWLAVRDRPTVLNESQVTEAAAIISGNTPVRLPIVYVTSGPGHRSSVDTSDLSEWLSGMAHVVVEPSRHFSFALAHNVDRRNPYGGTVAVFWPRALDRHTRFLPYDFDSVDDLASAIADRVRVALAAVRPTAQLTWSYLQEVVARHRVDALRSAGSLEIQQYVDAFDEELAAKDERIAEADRENARLLAALRRSEAAADLEGGLLSLGAERELYPGEIRDAVLCALRLGLSGLEGAGRRRHIVADLLTVNAGSGNDERIADQLKQAFAAEGNLTAGSRRVLEELGFVIDVDGKHDRATYYGDERYSFVISKTSSDHRAGKNLASTMNRKLFK